MSLRAKGLRFSTAAVFSLALLLSAETQAREKTTPDAPIQIFNFGEISPAYFRGGELNGENVSGLAARGVKTIIDLRSDSDYEPAEGQFVASAGMTYVRIPMTTRMAPTTEQISKFLGIVTDGANQPVYVHCVEGRHRTGVMTAIYRMTVDGWSAERAFGEMKDYKFGLDFLHPEFKKFVYGYRPALRPETAQASTALVGTN